MAADLYTFVSYRVKEKRLRTSPPFAVLNSEIGAKLLARSDSALVSSAKGYLRSNMRAYFFQIGGLTFYFESTEELTHPNMEMIEVDQIEIPRA